MSATKPLPEVSPWSAPHWEAAKQGRLLIQRCANCARHVFYPRLYCPHCGADQLDWVEASGRGTVYTFTVVEHNPPSAFKEDLPFVIAIVRLAEGVQMMTNIVGCDPAAVHCEMPVEVTFERLSDDFTLPKFKPAGQGG